MTINNRRTNPIAARVLPLQGQQLPGDFNSTRIARTPFGTLQMDNRPLEELWKTPRWSGKGQDNATQQARLSGPIQQQEPPQV